MKPLSLGTMLMMNTSWSIVLGVGLGCYWAIKLYPKPNRLHQKNQRIAKRLLKKLKVTPHTPSEVFGLLRREHFFVFEELLLLCFKARGYQIQTNKAYTGDGGIDGTFFDKAGNKFLIQAKRYKSAINPKHVSEFTEVVRREKATGGFFIHTGRTGAKSYQNLTPEVRIISGEKLLTLLNAKLSKSGEMAS